jgi:hypothetical protein
MKKLYFIFVAFMISQNLFAITKEWKGTISTDWANADNWMPSGVPTATDLVTIPNVANKPIILSGTTAKCLRMEIGKTILTINSGGSLNVVTDVATSNRAINISTNGTLTNNGILTISTSTNVSLIVLNDNATFNNSGTVELNTPLYNILVGGPNSIVNNTTSGIINFQSSRGFQCLNGTTGNIITNQGTMNYLGYNYFAALNPNFTINNSGTIDIKNGQGISVGGGTLNNLACGKILMPKVAYDNSGAGSLTTNAGLIVAQGIGNTNGTFNNTGVINQLPTVGTVTNIGDAAVHVQSKKTPIFAYSSTFSSTINGIFKDSLATVSAGTFAAPNTFTALATLPKGLQTLYVKITSSGGACTYIVPFTYNNMTTSTADLANNVVELQQNRPNPFSQETTISFALSETNKADLTVYDITGRQVFTLNNDFKIGDNEVILDKSVFLQTGIYFYRLTSGKFSAVKKLHFISE